MGIQMSQAVRDGMRSIESIVGSPERPKTLPEIFQTPEALETVTVALRHLYNQLGLVSGTPRQFPFSSMVGIRSQISLAPAILEHWQAIITPEQPNA